MSEKKCEAEGCQESIYVGTVKGDFCIFHLPSEFKDNFVDIFTQRLNDKISRKDFNFRYFVFPKYFDFKDIVFENDVDFYCARFEGKKDVSETQNRMPACVNFCGALFKKSASFEQVKFLGGDALFINTKFDGEKANFNGAQFVGGYARFGKANFHNNIKTDFDGAKFHKGANFKSTEFHSLEVGFWEAEVLNGHAFFWSAIFDSNLINFENFRILSGNGEFNNCKFSSKIVSFNNASFKGNIAFNDTIFSGNEIFNHENKRSYAKIIDLSNFKVQSGSAEFNNCIFSAREIKFCKSTFGQSVSFNYTEFSGRKLNFEYVRFEGNIELIGTILKIGIDFSKCSIGQSSSLRMENINLLFLKYHKNELIIFERFPFNPFMTFIEGIKIDKDYGIDEKKLDSPILFRYCQLKDVYFARNDMALFSFYKSTFDEARFFSSNWGSTRDYILKLPFTRKNVLNEEKLLRSAREIDDPAQSLEKLKYYKLDDINGFEDVGTLYRSMKTALDNSKDYQEAGWFYFNEFEMKRLALIDKIKEESKKSDGSPKRFRRAFKSILSKRPLYWAYKVFAGYGEKPLWSAIWFVIYSALAAIFQLFSGIQLKVGAKIINYDLSSNIGTLFSCQLWCDICETWKYSVYRLIPNNYFTSKDSTFIPIDDWGVFLTIVNTVILALFIVFIGIGLKRHFRRF
jgi:hypothetical protein